MPEEAKNKAAPRARRRPRMKPIYYIIDAAEKLDFEKASGLEGVDDEIALLRVKIKAALARDPENLEKIIQATNALARLITTRYCITREQRKGLKEAIGNVLREVGLPLGISVGANVIGKRLGQ